MEDHIKEELAADGSSAGVEEEVYRPYPFDSDKISIARRQISLDVLVKRLERKLIVAAEMQREADLWDNGKKSRLIESILLRIPLPLFYAAADKNDVLFIVDGLQRVSAIRSFVLDKTLILSGLEFLKELEGKRFIDLPVDLCIRMEETELQFAVIQPESPPEVQRNIFKRLNTGGLPLSDQEIRHALYYGPVAKYLEEFAQAKKFIEATTGSVKDSRMAARELALRFIAFTMFGAEGYQKEDDMDSFLSDTMQVVNALKSENPPRANDSFGDKEKKRIIKFCDLDEIKERFLLAMTRAEMLFGTCAFRPSSIQTQCQEGKRRPIGKPLFEVWSVTLSTMAEDEYQALLAKRDVLDRKLNEIYDRAHRFRKYCGSDSSKESGVTGRYEVISEILQSILKEDIE